MQVSIPGDGCSLPKAREFLFGPRDEWRGTHRPKQPQLLLEKGTRRRSISGENLHQTVVMQGVGFEKATAIGAKSSACFLKRGSRLIPPALVCAYVSGRNAPQRNC
jgi:hypothetical protein